MVNPPTLSPKCQLYFDRFVDQANKRSPFPTDWELFYDFVHICHEEESAVNSRDLYPILINAGFPQESAQPLSGFYGQGRTLLNRPKGWDEIFDE